MSERVFSVVEIQTAIDNYKQQAEAAAKQLQELQRQAELTQQQQHMITGAVIALETLLNSPVVEKAAAPVDTTLVDTRLAEIKATAAVDATPVDTRLAEILTNGVEAREDGTDGPGAPQDEI